MARTGKKRRPAAVRRNVAAPSAPPAPVPKVWRPGVDTLEKDEELQFDPSTYDCLHAFHLGWPCLSFDIVRDTLGALRHEFPHTMFCVAGTQADASTSNTIAIVKLSNLTGKKRSPNAVPNDESGSESDDSEDEQDQETPTPAPDESSKIPKLEERMVPHQGCVNRIRSMPQQPHIVASWSAEGFVQMWDFSSQLNAVATNNDAGSSKRTSHPPLQICKAHKDEGFAMDWSPMTPGRFLSGDCKGVIHFWEPMPGGRWNVGNAHCLGHSGSVEDLQWSPSEENVFASCSVDKTIGIWDLRSRRKELSVKAHDTDVNVISWNKNKSASCLLASGSDNGLFRVWDLRAFKEDSAVAHFTHHSSYITSIEWSPHEESTLAVASADNQLTIWDVALERDTEEEAQYQMELGQEQAAAPENLPAQLLFVHQGQKDMKEVHWHPQIHGLLVSTAGDGFNVFRPCNL
ncbi:glutamate-rich WD repeat-containing protein 1 [Selaginella moellendorffii]|uniref:glutamate-rich WD repeat-containing protein 1 n=1 Tax=Selaginella moellendorffii TaxID=88036 RepID=UPI000D1C8CE5|nr:glutamate-rich WD repeat-containing protein 1 [Selaginella moellendorffii]|eukprot:XP_024538614.1 glutamate-rich WD repeat-containing protein 1 [Selaginella moellendorffii]